MKVEELALWQVPLIPGDSENGFLKDFSCSYSEPTQVPLPEKGKTARLTQFREFGNNGPVPSV